LAFNERQLDSAAVSGISKKITSWGERSLGNAGMLTATLIGLLAGMVLAQRFKVLVLLPIILAVLVVAIGVASARPQATWTTGQTVFLIVMGLQIGYLFGIGIRYVMVLAHGGQRRAASLTGSLPPR
jgi:uncharacterized membrane protein YqgA involved in biofilm formation